MSFPIALSENTYFEIASTLDGGMLFLFMSVYVVQCRKNHKQKREYFRKRHCHRASPSFVKTRGQSSENRILLPFQLYDGIVPYEYGIFKSRSSCKMALTEWFWLSELEEFVF